VSTIADWRVRIQGCMSDELKATPIKLTDEERPEARGFGALDQNGASHAPADANRAYAAEGVATWRSAERPDARRANVFPNGPRSEFFEARPRALPPIEPLSLTRGSPQ